MPTLFVIFAFAGLWGEIFLLPRILHCDSQGEPGTLRSGGSFIAVDRLLVECYQ